jgi:hypothetical protein
LGSSIEGFGNPTILTRIPKSMEEVVAKIMKVDKIVELFQTIAIVSLNMGNLTLKVNTLKNKLEMGKKEKVVL